MRENTENYRQLFLNDTPMIDLRAPIEFNNGSFPTAISLPLMTDEERALVGTCYKQEGQDAAIKLGHKLVSGQTKDERMARWIQFTQENPEGYLYCFRGGLRSRTTQQWLKDAGVEYPLVLGGYKALRSFLINETEQISNRSQFTIVGGKTGCAKTLMVNVLENAIDLEGAANHRGSSFGSYVTPQSTQINCENEIAIELMKKQTAGFEHIVLEDEGRHIGSVDMPRPLYLKMQNAPVVVIEDPLDIRIERLLKDYVIDMHSAYIAAYGHEEGLKRCAEYLLSGLDKIRKRLGNERWQKLRSDMENALQQQNNNGYDVHLSWLHPLLEWYYDPMYEYQLEGKADRIIFRGDWQECDAFLKQTTQVS